MSKLSNLGEVLNGKAIPKGLGVFPAFGGNGIITNVNKWNYSESTIVIGRVGANCGAIHFSTSKCWVTDNALAFVVNQSNNPYFVYYLLKLLDLNRFHIGSSQPLITQSIINEIDYDYISEKYIQTKIAKCLVTIDQKIDNNIRINREIQSMVKVLYDYWFLQFDFPNEEGKPYRFSGGKMIWSDEFKQEIPDGWEVNKVKDCIVHINTGLNPRNNFVLNDGYIKYITVKNLTTDGDLDFSRCDTISMNTKEVINKRSMISKGDILFASIAPLGRCYIIRETPIDWEINESVFSIRPNDKVSTEYLYEYFMSEYFIKKAEHSSAGSVFSGIRISTLQEMDIITPPKTILREFTEKVNALYEMKYKNSREIQELFSLRDFLLPLLMNGQVTIK